MRCCEHLKISYLARCRVTNLVNLRRSPRALLRAVALGALGRRFVAVRTQPSAERPTPVTDILDRKLAPSDLAVDSQMGEEAVLLNLESGLYFGLDPVGSKIWGHLKQGLTGREICALTVREFGVPQAQVEGDLRSFLADMLGSGLVEEQ